jgi:hypothetical protein
MIDPGLPLGGAPSHRLPPMIVRVILAGLFLVAAGAMPYLSSKWMKASQTEAGSDPAALDVVIGADGQMLSGPSHGAHSWGALHAKAPQAGEPPIVDLAEAIRFDITVPWLFHRWPRVTAGLPDGQLQGYRVPLVTGTREDDVAGSLTYFFNAQQVCQRITLQGAVGDPRKLAAHVDQFGLLRRSSSDPGLHLYQTRWNGKPVSELKIKAVPVVKASAPYARYDVQMVLNSWPRKPGR